MEEVAFRGVLQEADHAGTGGIDGDSTLSSVAFGAWHILPSLGLSQANAAMHAVGGDGDGRAGRWRPGGRAVFTSMAGVLLAELRRRSGSILAAAGLHWAVNALAVLIAAIVFAVTAS